MPAAKVREYPFDIVKFLAIAVIVLHHYQQDTGAFFQHGPNWYDGEFYWGYLVELFFIISGYFTLTSVNRIKSGQTIGAFYLKKYLRFLPLVLICGLTCLVAKYACLTYVDHQVDVSFTLWNVVASVLGVARWFDTALMVNNPMWYVSALLFCLLVFYAATAICPREDNLFLSFGGVIVLGLVMRALCADGIQAPFFNAYIARGLISFFVGLELALILKRHPGLANAKTSFFALAAIALFVLFYATDKEALIGYGDAQYYALVFLVYPAVVFLCKTPALSRLFGSEKLSFLGGCAYNMYVWHLPLLFVYRIVFYTCGWDTNRQLSMYLFLLICCVAGELSSRFIDRPIANRIHGMLKSTSSPNLS